MDWQTQNTRVYDATAQAMATYFKGIGSRIEDIEKALELAGKTHDANVLELGCGDGRDAAEIIKRVNSYIGIDPSQGFLSIAKNDNPGGTFVLSNAQSYNYPRNLDVIFAFASLLHVPMEFIREVFEKAQVALKPGGIFYISLKERSEYVAEVKKDEYGERMFYYYNQSIIEQLAGSAFETAYSYQRTVGNTDWFTIALKKR